MRGKEGKTESCWLQISLHKCEHNQLPFLVCSLDGYCAGDPNNSRLVTVNQNRICESFEKK